MLRANCRGCLKEDEEDKFRIVGSKFLDCGLIFYEEAKLGFRARKSRYFLCQSCYEKYNIINKIKVSPPRFVTGCFLCRSLKTGLDFYDDKWTVDFRTTKWCHYECISNRSEYERLARIKLE